MSLSFLSGVLLRGKPSVFLNARSHSLHGSMRTGSLPSPSSSPSEPFDRKKQNLEALCVLPSNPSHSVPVNESKALTT
jgi:hypothetical protein